MIVKKKFDLLKDVPNVLSLSPSVIKSQSVPGDRLNLIRSMKLIEKRVKHYTSKRIFKLTSSVKETKKTLHIVRIDSYPLSVSYNNPTKRIVINLGFFGVDEISRIDPMNIYACLVYGLTFSDLINQVVKIKDLYYGPITNYLGSVFVRIFGKEFGLLGPYATEISKLKFLIACYVLSSFFGVKGTPAYKKASTLCGIDYRNISDKLDTYDFSKVDVFINALSELKVLPGIDKHHFASKTLRQLRIDFFAAFEDLSRFISYMITSNIKGSNVVPTYIDGWNPTEYAKIISIGKTIFR